MRNYSGILEHSKFYFVFEGVLLNWDGDNFLEVGASSRYHSVLCGLCGNFNGFTRDDFVGGDGFFKFEKNEFANSWKVGTSEDCTRPQYGSRYPNTRATINWNTHCVNLTLIYPERLIHSLMFVLTPSYAFCLFRQSSSSPLILRLAASVCYA